MKKYIVELNPEERSQLKSIVNAPRMAAHKRKHAQILLATDQGPEGPALKDTDIAAAFGCTTKTVERLRQRCVEEGLETTLEHGNRGSYRPRKLDGQAEAHLIALTRMEPPEGHKHWGMRLLADQMVELGYVESCSHMAVQRALKKMNSSRT